MSDIPLDPTDTAGRSIGDSALEAADIIVSTTSAGVSRVIRAGTGSAVSHARLYVGGAEVIEAVGEGVLWRSLADALRDGTLAVAYRRKSMTPAAVDPILRFAADQVGKKYDYGGVATGGTASSGLAQCVIAFGIVGCGLARRGTFSSSDKFYCSQLVLEAFKRAHLPLTNGRPQVSNPGQIPEAYSTGLLLYVGHLL